MAFAVRRADRLVCFYLSRSPQHKGHTRFVLFFLSVSFRIPAENRSFVRLSCCVFRFL